ncbi:hypothetical protein [Streptomyces cavernicola]|uniref:TPM domain-containing protein n=1 Tax=Streptomyces cavernicola TaxID=3043613 RepID=A0ABT6SLG5_9ACTN|nr:hypothetical protein [Streptomyces sp. B-S-A6]MDI3408810.1 hypothetical protein [Streptomyces sp. B-S-A6]
MFTPAAGAAAAQPVSSAPQAAADPAGLDARAAYFAGQLRKSPIYVTDQTPRVMPRSAWPAFLEQARRTGVPTYVLVLPYAATADGEELLTAVREKLGRKGMYILLDAEGGGSWTDVTVESHGVRELPIQASLDSADEWLPSDATALDYFTAFVDGLLNEGDASGSGKSPSAFYTTPDARATQSTTTGVFTGLVPVLVLLIGVPLALRRGTRRRLLVPITLAGVLAVAVPLGAQNALSEVSSTGDPDPTGRDMQLRAERFAAGLRHRSVYLDAEIPPALTPRQLRSVERHFAALDVPVHVTVAPLSRADESEGRPERFAERLHDTLGKDGLYVTASIGEFDDISLDIVNYGAKLDELELYELDEWVAYGPEDLDADPQLHARLLKLAQHIRATPAGPPGRPYADDEPLTDPVAEDALPPLLTDPAGPLGLSGLFLAGLAGGAGVPAAIAGAVWLVRRVRRGDGRSERTRSGRTGSGRTGSGRAGSGSRGSTSTAGGGALGRDVSAEDARPDVAWLHSTAQRELGSLREKSAAARRRSGGDSETETLAAARDCLEAAGLVLDRDHDRRVDEDAAAVDLASGLALIRAGRAALDAAHGNGRFAPDTKLCTLNPLHGPSPMSARLSPTPGARARLYPVCADCGSTLGKVASAHRGGAVDRLRLSLPGRAGRTPYTALPGPLGEAGASGSVEVTGLVRGIRERHGAQR